MFTSQLKRRHLRKVYHANRRARVVGKPATLTTKQWYSVLDYWNLTCAYCGVHLRENVTLDHVIALSDPLSPGSTAANVVCACDSCNNLKTDRHFDEFLISLHGDAAFLYIHNLDVFAARDYEGTATNG